MCKFIEWQQNIKSLKQTGLQEKITYFVVFTLINGEKLGFFNYIIWKTLIEKNQYAGKRDRERFIKAKGFNNLNNVKL